MKWRDIPRRSVTEPCFAALHFTFRELTKLHGTWLNVSKRIQWKRTELNRTLLKVTEPILTYVSLIQLIRTELISVELIPTNLYWTSHNLSWLNFVALMKLFKIWLECDPSEGSCWHEMPKIPRIRASPLNVVKFESSRKRRWTWSTQIKDIGARHDNGQQCWRLSSLSICKGKNLDYVDIQKNFFVQLEVPVLDAKALRTTPRPEKWKYEREHSVHRIKCQHRVPIFSFDSKERTGRLRNGCSHHKWCQRCHVMNEDFSFKLSNLITKSADKKVVWILQYQW